MEKEVLKTRTESDLLGSVEVPENVLYGVQTMRGLENFAISKFRLCEYPRFIEGLAIVKLGAAIANHEMGLLPDDMFEAIAQACREIRDGKHHEFFPVDMIQGGAGTTTNMNANEVIANRALEIMGHRRGEYQYCSPNDHVNCSQSTNDAYPSALHMGLYATHLELREHLMQLIDAFSRKGDEFAHVLKMGRTQLQDAVPMTLGQTFKGFASVLQGEVDNLDHAALEFLSINMGATAIGTGICAEPGYAERCTAAIREITGWDVTLAEDLVGATSDTVCMVGYSSAMKRIASKMNKICNDLRLLSSGPRCGLNEFNLPARQRAVRDDGRRGRPDGTQRHGARHGAVLLRVGRAADERLRHPAHPLRRGHHGQRGALPEVRARQHRRRDGPQSHHRLQELHQDRQGGARDRSRRL